MTNNGIQVNKINEKTKKSFVVRLITALAIIVVGVPCLVLGDWFFFSLIAIVSVFATYEFIHVLHKKNHPKWIDILTFVMTISFIYWLPFKGILVNLFSSSTSPGVIVDGLGISTAGFNITNGIFSMTDIGVSTLGFAVLAFGLFLGSMLTSSFDVSDVCYYFTMSLFLSLSVQSFYFLRYSPNALADAYNGNKYLSVFLFLYVVVGSFGSDIGAYIIGILFGKHKVNPRISPNKTWEGFFGGVIISFVLSFVLGMCLCGNGIPLLNGILDLNHWYLILLFSLIMPIVSVLGDFIFSTIKRYYNIKDFSKALPGHGGILDRIDSLLVTSLTVTIFILSINLTLQIISNI